jgi:hypothetical protein
MDSNRMGDVHFQRPRDVHVLPPPDDSRRIHNGLGCAPELTRARPRSRLRCCLFRSPTVLFVLMRTQLLP